MIAERDKHYPSRSEQSTGVAKRVNPRFGEFCFCCCLLLLYCLQYSHNPGRTLFTTSVVWLQQKQNITKPVTKINFGSSMYLEMTAQLQKDKTRILLYILFALIGCYMYTKHPHLLVFRLPPACPHFGLLYSAEATQPP